MKSHRDIIREQLDMLDYSKVIVPVNLGVKFRPPKLGIEFYLKNDEAFDQSLSSRRNSHESLIINDLDSFSQKLSVHEVPLDLYFFTNIAQIHGERSYDLNRENSHMSPMKQRLSAFTITNQLYADKLHSAFLNPKILKFQQVERLI